MSFKTSVKSAIFVLAVIGMTFSMQAEANAGWGNGSGGSWGGSRGSSGGSYGYSRGSSGGSSGGWRFRPIRNTFARIHSRHSARRASRGSWGGSNGSSGGYSLASRGSSGGSSGGRYVYYGSSGGSSGGSRGYSYYSAPAIVVPADAIPYYNRVPNTMGPTPAVPVNPPSGNSTSNRIGDAVLTVNLPRDAKVFVNGKLTRTPGASRKYVSRNLVRGKAYAYEIKAVMTKDGKDVSQTRVVDLRAGVSKNLAFNFDIDAEVITSLSLNVPADADVRLGGVETKAEGPTRFYSTSALKKGQTWSKYDVLVTVVRDGKKITRQKTIKLEAGAAVKLDFDFGDKHDLIASR